MTESVEEAVVIALMAVPWTEEDAAWAEKHVPLELLPHAKKHGRFLFSLVMQAGTAGAALGQAQACVRLLGSKYQRQLGMSVQMQSQILNDMLSRIMKDNKVSQEMFNACRIDIETTGALMAAAAPTASGLILPSH